MLEHEALLAGNLDSFPDIVFFKTQNGVYLGCNPSFAAFVGRPRDEIVGSTDLELFPPGVAEVFAERDRRTLERRTPQHDEEWITCPDGRRRLIDTLETPYWGPDGTLIGVLGISRDITARKLAEEERRAEHDLFSAGPVATIVWDVTEGWPVRQVSSNIGTVIGYTAAEVLSDRFNFEALLHPDDLPRVIADVTAYLERHEDSYEMSYRLRMPDGEYRWFYDCSRAVRNDTGEVVQVRGYVFDQTRLKTTEHDLERQRQRLAHIIEGTNVGTWDWEIATGAVVVNERWASMLGYTLEELAPVSIQTWIGLTQPDDLADAQALLRRHFAGELDYYDCEIRMRHRAGHWVWVLDRGRVVARAADGTPLRMAGTHQDVTARRLAQEQLILANRRLEEAIARANEMATAADRANAAKSAFLANMSHEIRTPMNGVIGMAGLLLGTSLNEEQRRYAEMIQSSGESLLALINDILDLSKIEAGRLELETLDFDLIALLDDFATMLALRAQAKGLEFTCAADPDVPAMVRGDPGRLRQILTNLVGNAVKFTDTGEVAVRVSTLEPGPDGGAARGDAQAVLRFSVRDTGIGIPRDKIGMLFDKFSQVDASTTRRYGGTGLGLAISRQLATLMGGAVGVDSVAGRGSEFWFTARLSLQATQPRVDDGSPFRHWRALVVDDHARSREVLVRRLASFQVRASEAADGAAALQALRRATVDRDPFHLVFIGQRTPGTDGAALAREIRSDHRVAPARLICVTPLAARCDAPAQDGLGFAALLRKPVRHDDLRAVLSQALDPASPHSSRGSRAPARRAVTGRRARVLVVEDNLVNQVVALKFLERLGCQADAVGNGREALDALSSVPYGLVLMDVQMPEMDGYEATRAVRSWRHPGAGGQDLRGRASRLPIVAMTANAMDGDREACLAAGMNDYLSKPVRIEELGRILERWLPVVAAARSGGSTSGDDDPAGEAIEETGKVA